MYKIDSCFDRIKHRRYNVCQRPSFRTVCKRPIVNRNILTPDDYLNMLSTPKGFLWTGITSDYKQFSTDSTHKLKTFNKSQRSNFQKSYKQGHANYNVYGSKNWKDTSQQKILHIKNKKRREDTQNKMFYRSQKSNQKSKIINDVSISDIHSENANTFYKTSKTRKLQNITKRDHLIKPIHFTQRNMQKENSMNNKTKSSTQKKISNWNQFNNKKQVRFNDAPISNTQSVHSKELNDHDKTKKQENKSKREYLTTNHLTKTNTQSNINTNNETEKNGNTQIKIINRTIKNKYNNQNSKKFNDVSIANAHYVDKNQFNAYYKVQNKLKNKKDNTWNKKNDTIVHKGEIKSTKKYEKINKNEIGYIFKNKNDTLTQKEENKSPGNFEKINKNDTSIQNKFNKVQNKLKNKNKKGSIWNKKNDTIVYKQENKSTKKYEKMNKNDTVFQKEFNKYNKINKNEMGNIFKNKNDTLTQKEENKSPENFEKINENDKSIKNEFNKYNEVQNKNEIIENLINENVSIIQKEKNDSTEKLEKIEVQKTDYFLQRQKQLWLRAEKKRIKREEQENKFNSSLEAEQKAHEERKRIREEKVKMEAKRQQILEENQRKNNIEKEKMAKIQAIGQKKIIEEREKVKNETEKNLRLEVLKLEAHRIIMEEEVWRNKINQEFALKMDYKVNSNIHKLCSIPNIVNNQNDHKIGKIGNKRFIDYTKNLFKEIQQHDQVFDPGNLMKQMINEELNKTKKRQVKLRKKLNAHIEESPYKTENTQILEINVKNENQQKRVVLSKAHNKVCVNTYEQCVSNEQGVPKYKKPDVKYCNSNISFNTVVCHWKNDVADMKTNIQKRRCNFVQNAIANKMWKH